MAEAQIGNVSPEEAIQAIQNRVTNPVPEYSWLDVWQREHSQAFTVAKSAGYDVLGDIGGAVDDAIENGETFDQFKDKLIPVLQEKGWWGKGPALDPATGLWPVSQLGSLRRLQIIYDTNMRASFAAGSWMRMLKTAAERPYLMYTAVHDDRTRPQHRAWDGTILPMDDPWWDTHYPPNGWNCRCSVIQLSPAQAAGFGGVSKAPESLFSRFVNRRTGEVSNVPNGIDPGFGYNVGKAFLDALAGR